MTTPNSDRLKLSPVPTTQFIGISKPTALRKPTQVGSVFLGLFGPVLPHRTEINREGKFHPRAVCGKQCPPPKKQRVPITRSTAGLSARGVGKRRVVSGVYPGGRAAARPVLPHRCGNPLPLVAGLNEKTSCYPVPNTQCMQGSSFSLELLRPPSLSWRKEAAANLQRAATCGRGFVASSITIESPATTGRGSFGGHTKKRICLESRVATFSTQLHGSIPKRVAQFQAFFCSGSGAVV